MKNYWLDRRPKPQAGFPTDDMNSLCQMASESVNLNLYYDYQFVQNEEVNASYYRKHPCMIYLPLEHTPIIPNSITGTVFYKDTAVQVFRVNDTFEFDMVGNPEIYIIEAHLQPTCYNESKEHISGEIVANWNKPIDYNDSRLVVSYEYDYGA